MMFRTLISTDALATRLTDATLLVVDCRFKLDDVEWGRREYKERHISGAVYASLETDLSGPKTGSNGRHPLPGADDLVRTFGRLGIGRDVQVVAYDQGNGMFASRLWWMLRWLGHDAVAVLDGGFSQWITEGRPTSYGIDQRAERKFVGSPRAEMLAETDEIASRLFSHEWRLVDARSPERYRGENEPLDRVPGHIPGAVNHFFQTNLNDRGTFRSSSDLRAAFQKTIGGVDPDHVVCYCGSGVTACQNLLALEHAGLSGAKLYPGSWSEWSSDPARPVERSR